MRDVNCEGSAVWPTSCTRESSMIGDQGLALLRQPKQAEHGHTHITTISSVACTSGEQCSKSQSKRKGIQFHVCMIADLAREGRACGLRV